MNKAFSRINWENLPSRATPINEDNLNRGDQALNEIDDRVVELYDIKADRTQLNSLVSDIRINKVTGVITITWFSGSTLRIETSLSKIAVNFDYDPTTEELILYDVDGQELNRIDLKELITQYEFVSSDTVGFEITIDGKVRANVLDGSVTRDKISPDYLAEIDAQVQDAHDQADFSQRMANDASDSATLAESYAHGGTGTRLDEDADNAKRYADEAKVQADRANFYLNYAIPQFVIQNNRLYMKTSSQITFVTANNRLYIKYA